MTTFELPSRDIDRAAPMLWRDYIRHDSEDHFTFTADNSAVRFEAQETHKNQIRDRSRLRFGAKIRNGLEPVVHGSVVVTVMALFILPPGFAATGIRERVATRIPYRFSAPVSDAISNPFALAMRRIENEASSRISFYETSELLPDELVFDLSSDDFHVPQSLDSVEVAHVHNETANARRICFDMRWFRGYHAQNLYLYALHQIREVVALRGIYPRPSEVLKAESAEAEISCDKQNSAVRRVHGLAGQCFVNPRVLEASADHKVSSGRSGFSRHLGAEIAPPRQDGLQTWLGHPEKGLGITTPRHAPGAAESSQLAYVNNNPSNLRHAAGASIGTGGFAGFPSLRDGYCAYEKYVLDHAARGQTLAQYLRQYSPPNENDTQNYLNSATQTLHVSAEARLADIPIMNLARFQLLHESGTLLYGAWLDESARKPICSSADVVLSRIGIDSRN